MHNRLICSVGIFIVDAKDNEEKNILISVYLDYYKYSRGTREDDSLC